MVVSRAEHTMDAEEVAQFYPQHTGESYFLDLVDYMTSGPSIALVLAKITPGTKCVFMFSPRASSLLRPVNGKSGPGKSGSDCNMNPPLDERPVTDILKELRGPKDVVCAKQERPDCLRARFGRQTSKGVENVIHSSDNQVRSTSVKFLQP